MKNIPKEEKDYTALLKPVGNKQAPLEGLTTEEITEMVFCNKQETLEEVAIKFAYMLGTKDSFEYIKSAFIYGAKWQQEQNKNKSIQNLDKILQKLEEIKIMINVR